MAEMKSGRREEAERIVAERLGFKLFQTEVVSTDDTHLMWLRMGNYMGLPSGEEIALWCECVRLQTELLAQKEEL